MIGFGRNTQWCATKQAADAAKASADAALSQATVAQQQFDEQRPILGLGGKESLLAEYKSSRVPGQKGTIVLNVHNSGQLTAERAEVIPWPQPIPDGPAISTPQRRLATFQIWWKGQPSGQSTSGGATISVGSTVSFAVPPEMVPTPDEWASVERGERDYHLQINFEFCDVRQRYQCSGTGIRYESALGRFVPMPGVACRWLSEPTSPAGGKSDFTAAELVNPCAGDSERREAAQKGDPEAGLSPPK